MSRGRNRLDLVLLLLVATTTLALLALLMPPSPSQVLVYGEGLKSPASSSSCGYFALAACCHMLGVDMDPAELHVGLNWNPTGLTMREMRRALTEDLGLHALGLRMTPGRLAALEGPVILAIEGGRTSLYPDDHYVVYAGWRECTREFVLVDPMRGTLVVSSETLEAIWTGLCLVVRAHPVELGAFTTH